LKRIIYILVFTTILLSLYHCRPDRVYIENSDATLRFSLDTVYFDTVFTTIGTSTRSFRIYNPHSRFIMIDEIHLAGGEQSVFRINVDGSPGTRFEGYEIAPNDSMFVFVEATLDPNMSPDILRIQDSITFSVNGNLQDVDLMAWGQDVHMKKGEHITEPTVWTADKPYLIIDSLVIDTFQSLTISEGARIHMHSNAFFKVIGTIEILGDADNPVIIQGDRLEEFYSDKPGQWGFIFFQYPSTANVINHAKIINGTVGLYVNSPNYGEEPVLKISNTEINQMSYDGILAQGTSIEAYNTVIGDCGNSCVELIYEGSYRFNHCTFANYWRTFYSNRKTPAVFIANYVPIYDSVQDGYVPLPSDIEEATFTNSIIYGSRNNEILISRADEGTLNYTFDHLMARLDEEVYNFYTDPNFKSIYVNQDPMFDSLRVSYELDSLSPAINAGDIGFATEAPLDKNGNSRLRPSDQGPDLGAYEFISE